MKKIICVFIFLISNNYLFSQIHNPNSDSSNQITHTSESSGIPSWDSLYHFIAIVIGVLLSFWIERKIKAKRALKVQKSFLKLIADEVQLNIEKMTKIVTQAEQTIVPYYQLITENKDAIWSMLVEYPVNDTNLIDDIKKTYLEYKLINRTLDIMFFKEGHQSPIFGSSTLPLCKKEIEQSKKLFINLRSSSQ
jgi:hypothetical protein